MADVACGNAASLFAGGKGFNCKSVTVIANLALFNQEWQAARRCYLFATRDLATTETLCQVLFR